jgi:hypothetical protein
MQLKSVLQMVKYEYTCKYHINNDKIFCLAVLHNVRQCNSFFWINVCVNARTRT